MASVLVKYTYRDLQTTPDDRHRYEIFEGDLIVTPAPNEAHQNAVANIHIILGVYVRERRLGKLYTAPFDVYFDEETVVEPDILFVSIHRSSIIEKQRVKGAPDLIVEVLSPSTEERDRGFKFKRYAQEGVKEYWIVDPDNQTLEVYTLAERGFELLGRFSGGQEVRSNLLEGLRFSVAEAWR